MQQVQPISATNTQRQTLSRDILKQVALMNTQLSLIRANVNTDTWLLNNLTNHLSEASNLLSIESASATTSKSKKTNVTAPTEGVKRGRRPLPRDANSTIIRRTFVSNNVKSEKKEKI